MVNCNGYIYIYGLWFYYIIMVNSSTWLNTQGYVYIYIYVYMVNKGHIMAYNGDL